MAIVVQGYRDRAVSHDGLDGFYIRTSFNEKSSAGVSQVVEPNPAHTGRLDRPLETPPQLRPSPFKEPPLPLAPLFLFVHDAFKAQTEKSKFEA